MEKQINLTCKRAERPIEYLSFGEPKTFFQKGYEVYDGDKPVCFISKDDTLGEWNANSFDDYENCEGLCGGLTKKEVLANIKRCLWQGTLYLTQDERKAKRKAEREQDERNHNAIVEYRKAKAELEAKEVSELEAKEVSELEVSVDTRALIQSGQIKEGTKVIVKKDARIPYRAEGGCYGADHAKNDFEATVVKAYSHDCGEGAYGKPYVQSKVVVVTDNGVEIEVECGICYYSAIDKNGFVVLAQDEVAELEVSEDEVKEAKSDEACKLFNELDDDGLVDTKHYDTALCQKQNVQYHWDWDLTVEDIETVIEYFKNLKQLIALERKVNKLAIYG